MIKSFFLLFPFDISVSVFSHLAVNSGLFKSAGAKSKSCLPFDVMCISLFFISTKNELNNFSIISALVATVPRLFFSISVSNVASFKYEGGLVFLLSILTLSIFKTSPTFTSIIPPYVSSSSTV